MSALEIIEELQKLSPAELAEVRSCLGELEPKEKVYSLASANARLEYVDGKLFIATDRVILQSEVDEVLNDFP